MDMTRLLKLMAIAAVVALLGPNTAFSVGSSAFFRTLYEKPQSTRGDLVKAILFVLDAGDTAWSVEESVEILKEKGVIPKNWKINPDETLKKGFLSNVLVRTIRLSTGLRHGLMIRFASTSDRYAYRECVFHKLVPPGGEKKKVTGGELAGSINRTVKFIKEWRNYR